MENPPDHIIIQTARLLLRQQVVVMTQCSSLMTDTWRLLRMTPLHQYAAPRPSTQKTQEYLSTTEGKEVMASLGVNALLFYEYSPLFPKTEIHVFV
jgi:hypothetical protein